MARQLGLAHAGFNVFWSSSNIRSLKRLQFCVQGSGGVRKYLERCIVVSINRTAW